MKTENFIWDYLQLQFVIMHRLVREENPASAKRKVSTGDITMVESTVNRRVKINLIQVSR